MSDHVIEGRPPEIFASNIFYSLGDRVAIENMADDDIRGALTSLHEQGLRYCRVDRSKSSVELALAAARPALEKIDRRDVDMIVYCTDTPTDRPPTRYMWQMQTDLGLAETPAMLVTGGGCGNFVSGLNVARALMTTEGLWTVLFVTLDRSVRRNGRYLVHGETVKSDAAAACILTAEPIADGFRILGMATDVKADVSETSSQLALSRTIMKKVGRALGRASAQAGVQPADCRYFITGNFGQSSRAFLTAAVKCQPEQAYSPWVSELGHCFSADIPINLSTLMERKEIDARDRLLILGSSPQSWSVMFAEYAPA